MKLQTLADYADICSSMERGKLGKDSVLVGFVRVSKSNFEKLNSLKERGLCSAGIELFDENYEFKANKQLPDFVFEEKFQRYLVKVELLSEKIHDKYFICQNWNTLLSYPSYLIDPVSAVYIGNEKTLHSSENPSVTFKRYQSISKVCRLIKEISNDVTASKDYLILFGQSLKINFKLNVAALQHDIDPEPLEELISADLHQEAKKALVREALVSFLNKHDKQYRLEHLVTHFNAFSTQLLTSYEQYVSNYSFDKVRKEYQEKRTEYVVKMNKVFDDVAAKTFAIPAGVWLAATQIEEAKVYTLGLYKNLTFVLLVLVLCAILCMNLLGQFSSLEAVKSEYKPLFERLKTEVDDKEDFDNTFQELESRYEKVWWKLAGSIFIAVVLFMIVIVLVAVAFPENQ